MWVIVAGLASWRITHLIHGEDGPWRIFERVRRASEGNFVGKAIACFMCLSVLVAAPLAVWVASDWQGRLLLWPALSAGAILIERAAFPEGFEEPPDWTEDKEA